MTNVYKNMRSDRSLYLKSICLKTFPVVLIAIGLWIPIYAIIENWAIFIIQAAMFVSLIFCFYLTQKNNINLGLLFGQLFCISYIFIYASFVDHPIDDIPRVTHLYLLVIALFGYANYQRNHSRPQLILIALAMLLFVLLSSVNIDFSVVPDLPSSVRQVAVWVHSISVAVLLCAAIIFMDRYLSADKKVAKELRQAIEQEQFELFFQPQVDHAGKICGAEALIRWKHPVQGYVQPNDFIPLAEQTGAISYIDDWVLEKSITTLAVWKTSAELRTLKLAVNVNAYNFLKRGFVQNLIEMLNLHDVSPSNIKLELTESMMVSQIDDLISIMNELNQLGIAISLDDFGTGYSSLSYLRRLPLHQIKIDRSFIRGIAEGKRGMVLVKNIVSLAQELELEILAEGIENADQHKFMLLCGCSMFQGYYFGRPLPLHEFKERVLCQ